MKAVTTGAATLALSLLFFTGAAADGTQPAATPPPATPQQCRIGQIESLPMDTLSSGEFTVPVSLNDRPYHLQVDTGSDKSSITGDIADQLHLEQKVTLLGGAFLNNVPTNTYVEATTISIGHVHSSTKWPLLIDPDGLLAVTVAGLLGTDVMANYDVEFDFYTGKMNLFEPITCDYPVYWSTEYSEMPIQFDAEKHIGVEATLDGRPVKVMIDTGSPDSVMSLEAARTLFGWRDDDPRVVYDKTIPINGGKDTPFYRFPFQTLSFGGVTVQNPKVALIPQANFGATRRNENVQIVLGMSVIRQLHMLVAYRESKLYLTGAESYRKPAQKAP